MEDQNSYVANFYDLMYGRITVDEYEQRRQNILNLYISQDDAYQESEFSTSPNISNFQATFFKESNITLWASSQDRRLDF